MMTAGLEVSREAGAITRTTNINKTDQIPWVMTGRWWRTPGWSISIFENHNDGTLLCRKAVVKERLELELLRRQLERKKREAEYASEDTPVTIDPFRDEELYKPKKQIFKTQFELDFENKWREKFGESYHGGL